MSAGDRDTLALAELLHKHRHHLGVCTCGYGEGKQWGIDEVLHRAHVADVLLASDWLREQRADAWDEGRASRSRWAVCPDCMGNGCGICRIAIPYRRTTEDTDAH